MSGITNYRLVLTKEINGAVDKDFTRTINYSVINDDFYRFRENLEPHIVDYLIEQMKNHYGRTRTEEE